MASLRVTIRWAGFTCPTRLGRRVPWDALPVLTLAPEFLSPHPRRADTVSGPGDRGQQRRVGPPDDLGTLTPVWMVSVRAVRSSPTTST